VTFTASVTTVGLSAGVSNAIITVGSTNADNAPQSVAVQLTVQSPPMTTNRLLFDFGTSTNMTLGNWNNVTNNALAVQVVNAINSTGGLSGVSLRITDLFHPTYTYVNGGVAASNRYPQSAQQDYFAAGDGNAGAVRLEGLNTNQTYTLTFFGSRALAGNRVARYSVGAAAVTLDGLNNSNNVAVLSQLTPNASGQIEFVVSNNTVGANYGYLGVLDVTWETPQNGNDADADGIPNDWEQQYFGTSTGAVASATASNGVNTVLECYIAGLNPIDPSSAFLISDLRPLSSASILRWNSTSGRVYSVYWSSNLLNGFHLLQTNYTGGVFTDAVHGAEPNVFYQIEVQVAP
jgi:hypothetical protein